MKLSFQRTKRKLLGLFAGLMIGSSVSIMASKNANALGFSLSAEDLLEYFLKTYGMILMRFFSNRFISNLQNVMDNTSDKINETNQESLSDQAKAIAKGYDSQKKAIEEQAKTKLQRESVVPSNSCTQLEFSVANQSINNFSAKFKDALNKRNASYLAESDLSTGTQQIHRNNLLDHLAENDGRFQIKQLHLLVGVNAFSDASRAEQELAALVSHIGGQWGLDDNSGVGKAMAVQQAGKEAMVNSVVGAINHLFAQRLKATSLPSEILNTLSNNLATRYQSKKLSGIELLEAEVLASSENDKFYEEVANLPSVTTATVMMNNLMATSNKLKREILVIDELASQMAAISGILESEASNESRTRKLS